MQAVGVERTGHLVADQLTHACTRHRPGKAGQDPAVGECVVGRPAPEMIDGRRREPLLHQEMIEQLVFGDALEVRQPGSMAQHVAHGDLVLAAAPNSGQYVATGSS